MAGMTEEKAKEMYHGGMDCGQVTFGYGLELMGMEPEYGYKAAACFGGGMFHGHTCGCVTGGLMAIGMKYGHYKMNDPEAKEEMMKKKAEFEEAFIAEHGTLICRELLGYNIPEDMETIMQKGLLDSLCPKLAVTACNILEELL
ncbi:MAG: C-GCAxxG-C-C family protein [Eubacteriales bacterium]|nr:C-GCAxxG-C-C family protein [Eubacteriales bacterium]